MSIRPKDFGGPLAIAMGGGLLGLWRVWDGISSRVSGLSEWSFVPLSAGIVLLFVGVVLGSFSVLPYWFAITRHRIRSSLPLPSHIECVPASLDDLPTIRKLYVSHFGLHPWI